MMSVMFQMSPYTPGYGMAAPDPLDSQYEQEMKWTAERRKEELLKHLQRLWTFKSVGSRFILLP